MNNVLDEAKKVLIKIDKKLTELEKERDELVEKYKNSKTEEERLGLEIKMRESELKFRDLLDTTKIVNENIKKFKNKKV